MIVLTGAVIKTLLVAYWVSTMAIFAAVLIEPVDVVELQDTLGMNLVSDLSAGLGGVVLILLMLAATVGIFKEKFWGKHLFLAANFAGLVFTGLTGYLILDPASASLDYLNSLIAGALLLALYLESPKTCSG